MVCTIYMAKTKALISCEVTVQLICAFVFAYEKSRFSRDGLIIMSLVVIYMYVHDFRPGMTELHRQARDLSFWD